jgi:hypothetical protein
MLVALQEQGGGTPLRAAWAEVLGVPEPDVQYGRFGLPLVARVLSEAIEEAERATEEIGISLRRDYIDEWRKPVFAPGGNLDAPLQQQGVHGEALNYLANIRNVLQKKDRRPALPEGDELTGLLEQVDDLAGSVEAAEELSAEVKRALLRRINDLRFAIEHVRVGGAEGVEEAVERLVGALGVRHAAVPKTLSKRILAMAGTIFTLFAAGPVIQDSIEAWGDMSKPVIEAVQPVDGDATEDDEAEQSESAQPPNDEQASRADER